MPELARIPGLGLTQTELKNIDKYRKQKNTAVLTIMFTDIQGFTALTDEKGESYVHELHSQHDDILVNTIQENNAGVVIKFIGDSIMAVFSEPTAAVEKSLLIQKRLHEFNIAHPQLDDIKVRIGLHMGQTVIENKMQADLFGRHVNKASRIEGLADGGHVFISYSVFDSVKTWLIDNKDKDYRLHGSYLLKGIKKPEEIYEVYNKDITKPKAPGKGKKIGINPMYFALAGGILLLVCLISIGTYYFLNRPTKTANNTAVQQPNENDSTESTQNKNGKTAKNKETVPDTNTNTAKTETSVTKPAETPVPESKAKMEIYFTNFYPEEALLDLTQPLGIKSVNGDKKLLEIINDIPAGKHVLHYIVARGVRYFADISVKDGKNVIEPKFFLSDLPAAEVNMMLGGKTSDSVNHKNTSEYFYYTLPHLTRVTLNAEVYVEVKAEKISEETTKFEYAYKVTISGKVVAEKTQTLDSPMGVMERTYFDEIIVYEDAGTRYKLAGSYANNVMNFEVYGIFKDP